MTVSHFRALQHHGANYPGNYAKKNKGVTGDSQHGFTKGQWYLANLGGFYNGVVVFGDKWREQMSSTILSTDFYVLF